MFSFLSSNADRILAIMRILIGINFAVHGWQKLMGILEGASSQMPAPMLYTATGIEFLGGILIALGLFTGWAAFFSSGLMAAAYFIAHAPEAFLPFANKGELALTYCWFFLFLAAYGPGAWSLDGLRSKA